jgi:neutral ceramidase
LPNKLSSLPTLQVGVAEIDITPPSGLPMDGYMARTGVSVGIHDPLLAQVLVLDIGSTRLALVTLDLLAVSASTADAWRKSLAATLGITPEAVMICASHTHAGPAGLQSWLPIGVLPSIGPKLNDRIGTHLNKAAQLALSRMVPVQLNYAVGEIDGLGGDRNEAIPAPDPRVTAFRFDRLDGKPVVVVFHYACHPTVLGPQLEYSADFPGAARLRIQEHYPGITCLYLNGAAGNISTRFFRRDQSFDEVVRLGNLLGDHVIALLEHPEPIAVSNLGAVCKRIELPVREFSTIQSRSIPATGQARLDQTRTEGAAIEMQLAQAFRHCTAQSAALCAFEIGPWRLIGVPGEAFNELSAALRLVSQFALVVGYANDYLGYFPTQKSIDAQTYEALSSPYDANALNLIYHTLLTFL